MTSEFRQGDVYWYDFGPGSGSKPAERHPCVIVQSDLFNRTRIATTVVCVITSNMELAAAPGNVPLTKGEARLTKPSVVNVSQVITVNKVDLEQRVGHLTASVLADVLAGLRMIFEDD